MSRKPKYKIISFKAVGTIIPHSLRDIQMSLSRMGHRVYVIDVPAISDSKSREIAIMDTLVEVDPDFVITIDNVGLIPQQYLELKPELKIISWFFDNPLHFLHNAYPLINSRYFLFCWDKAYEEDVRNQGIKNFHYMPFGTNPYIYKTTKCEKIYDISFVGTWSERRQFVLEELAGRGFAIDLFGDKKWQRIAHKNIRFHGFADNREECPLIYNQSKINLNITNEQLLTSLPVRIFDVGACGSFLLTDDQKDAEEMFENNELVIYKDLDDLALKLQYFLEQDEERELIAQNLQKKIIQNFTFETLLENIFNIVNKQNISPPHPIHLKTTEFLWKAGLSCIHKNKELEAIDFFQKALAEKIENEKLHSALIVALTYSLWKINDHASVEYILSQNPSLSKMFNKLCNSQDPAQVRSILYGLKIHSFDAAGNILKGTGERVFA
jgi:spore maturation protein CgeB